MKRARSRRIIDRHARLRSWAMTIPHAEALRVFLTRFPEEHRAEMHSALKPHLQLDPAPAKSEGTK